MELTDFLIQKFPFHSELDYSDYKSPNDFEAKIFPYMEIPFDSIYPKIKKFYNNLKSELVDEELHIKNHNPPIRIRVREQDLGDDYFFELKVRPL